MDRLEAAKIRKAFVRHLTVDSEHQDRRKKDYNQAVFNADTGNSTWTNTSIDMVLDKFDKAINEMLKPR